MVDCFKNFNNRLSIFLNKLIRSIFLIPLFLSISAWNPYGYTNKKKEDIILRNIRNNCDYIRVGETNDLIRRVVNGKHVCYKKGK